MQLGERNNTHLPKLDPGIRRLIPRSTLRYWLKNFMGLEYAYGKKGVYLKGETRHLRIRKFTIEFYRALKLEETGEYVIVYTDESYINQNHGPLKSWFPVNGLHGTEKTTSKGKRLIVLHAITKDGFLSKIDTESIFPIEEDGFTGGRSALPTAEWIWPANSKHKVCVCE